MVENFVKSFQIADVAAHRIVGFRDAHRLGAPPELTIDVVFDAYQDIVDMIGHPAVLEYAFGGAPTRTFAGIVESATLHGTAHHGAEIRRYRYQVVVVSRLALLGRSIDSRIFQDLDVQEIVTKVLEDHGIPAGDQDWQLSAKYPKRAYCVQYQESALAFVSRLLEEEGIFYFVESGSEGNDRVSFRDDSTTLSPIAGDPELSVRARTGLAPTDDAIYFVAEQQRVRSGKYVLRDYDFERPKLDMTSEQASDIDTDLEVYDYPGGYFEPAEGARLVAVRLQAEQSLRRTVEIETACTRVTTGHKLKIADAGPADGEWVVTSLVAVHTDQDAASPRDAGARGKVLVARATLVPATVKYRTPRRTPVPVIEGPQTARVMAPAGSPSETIHTDEHGRCKVKFAWDRGGPDDDGASCWMRVSQLQTSGSMVLPRIEWEVVVEFLEGNPDRPIVTGRLYNGVFMPPYALPEGKTRTSLASSSTPGGGGRNEIRFEDKAGSEEIMIQSQYDTAMTTANNKKKTVGNNETSVVKNNAALAVGANQDVKITKGAQNTIGANQDVSVGGNRKVEVNAVTGLTVGGSSTTSVGGNQFEMDGNPLEAILALAAQKAAEFAAAKAGEAIAKIQGQVDGAVNQAMGPINRVTGQAQALAGGMQAVANGDLSAAGGLMAGAAAIPGASSLAGALGGGGAPAGRAAPPGGAGPSGGLAGTTAAPGTDGSTAAGVAAGNALSAAANTAIQRGVGAAHSALANALGVGAGGGGGASEANAGGPAGDVAGIDATDREKGPGHSTAKISGTHDETVGSLKVMAVLNGVNTHVAGAMTQNVGAAHVELVIGSRAESVEGAKTENALGVVVLSKGGESEQVSGAKTSMVGGAVIDKIKGSHAIQAGAPAMLVGAFHKIDAKQKITFKCGGSSVVIDGSGITIESPMVTINAGKIQLPKKVAEV